MIRIFLAVLGTSILLLAHAQDRSPNIVLLRSDDQA